LALDAVYNLKKQYNIDDRRVYQMGWNVGAMELALATSDVFTGYIDAFDQSWGETIRAGNGLNYPSSFRNPPGSLYSDAKSHPFVLIASDNPEFVKQITLKTAAMKGDEFEHIMQISLSPTDDLHYPNMKAEWFDEKVLPFLDQFATENPKPGTRPSVAGGDGAATQPSKAATWLSVAKILITNGHTDLAKSKLRAIIATYPNDPEATEAKGLLANLGG
jgi:hypothetical protein